METLALSGSWTLLDRKPRGELERGLWPFGRGSKPESDTRLAMNRNVLVHTNE